MTKLPRFIELRSDDALEKLLDAIHGVNRPSQIPGHYGNGVRKEKDNG